MKSMAPTVWISSHTRTHLPHRMHLAGSRTIDGLDDVHARTRARPPNSAAAARPVPRPALQLAVAAAHAVQAVVGVIGQQQFDDASCGRRRRGASASAPSCRRHREGAARHQAALAFDLDHAHAAGAAGGSPSKWHSVGTRDARAPHAAEHLSPFCASTVRPLTSIVIMISRHAVGGRGTHRIAQSPLDLRLSHRVEPADLDARSAARCTCSAITWCGLLSVPTIASPGISSRTPRSPCTGLVVDRVSEQFGARPAPGSAGRRCAPRTRRGTSAAC